jgi:hypothetical protein
MEFGRRVTSEKFSMSEILAFSEGGERDDT